MILVEQLKGNCLFIIIILNWLKVFIFFGTFIQKCEKDLFYSICE